MDRRRLVKTLSIYGGVLWRKKKKKETKVWWYFELSGMQSCEEDMCGLNCGTARANVGFVKFSSDHLLRFTF